MKERMNQRIEASRWRLTALLAWFVCGGLLSPGLLAAQEPAAPEVQVNADRVSLKLIPDCKAFEGAPPTHIDLAEIFAETIVDTGEPLTLIVERNSKPKIATAKIEGNQLTLRWSQCSRR